MRNVTRADGSSYLVSTRTMYCAIGWFPPEARELVIKQLGEVVNVVHKEVVPEQSVLFLPLEVRGPAIRAIDLIRTFDASVNEDSGPVIVPETWANHPDCIGVFSDAEYGKEHSDLADQVGRALADLLRAMGGIDVFHSNVD